MMAASAIPSHHLFVPITSSPSALKTRARTRRVMVGSSSTPRAALSDPFVLQLAETLEDSVSERPSASSSPLLQKLRDASSQSLLSMSWPSRKDEPFRFTDTSFIRYSQIHPVSISPHSSNLGGAIMSDTQFPNTLTVIDGHFVSSLSQLSELPDGVFVGSISELSSGIIMERALQFASEFSDGDLFWSLNGIGAPDVTVVYVPAGCLVESPLHFRFCSLEGGDNGSNYLPISNPRVLVLVEKGGEINIIEEYVGDTNKCYWTNSVMEVVIGGGGRVTHSYIQGQSVNAAHIKWTSVRQESSSTYELIEISTGGKLSRHNLHVQQVGPDTSTEVSTFHLAASDQTQDLHSRLVLDHPGGYSQQLHKCIVAHASGQAVFDGNIKVNRYAQKTDAGQLTRSLLLVPRATVNVKPNLQIIADDVKCSHGAAISDLEEHQLFYFQQRGIDLETARKALVFAFGAEVVNRLPHTFLRKKVESNVQRFLEPTLKGSLTE